MSKKHFAKLAESVRQIRNPQTRRECAEAIARVCATFNPRFDHARFFAACGV